MKGKIEKNDKKALKMRKKQEKMRKKQEKFEKYNFERYGIKPDEMKGANSVKSGEVKKGYPALRRCLAYFKNYKRYLLGIIIGAILLTGINVLTPIFTQQLIDDLTIGEFSLAIKFTIIIIVIEVIKWIINYFWQLIDEVAFQNVIRNLRTDLIDNLAKTKTKKFDEVNSGTIISRINRDTSSITNVILNVIDNVAGFFEGIAFVVYMFVLSPWIGIATLVFGIIEFSYDTFYQNYRYKFMKRRNVVGDKVIGFTGEYVRGVRDAKGLNIKENLLQHFRKNIGYLKTVYCDNAKKGYLLRNIESIIRVISQYGTLILAIILTSLGHLTIGGLMVVFLYQGRALLVLNSIQAIRSQLREASISAERVVEILDDKEYPKETFGTKTIKNPQGNIEFRDVSFSYGENKVLDKLSLTVEANKSVALVGKSGQGKSTLLSLIPRLYDIDDGKILIDGVDISTLSEDGLRNIVSIVQQTPYIFNATIKENLQFVKPDLTDEEMIDVCKKAQIHDFIMEKEKGYDSMLGENGVILSGGQKQRLAIARALLKGSKIILFDEATSALDNENQYKIQQVIADLSKDHTILIVAHRLSTVVNCDKIYMLEKGKIVGQGTHKEMMKKCAPYKALYSVEQKASELQKLQENE